ncbi:tetratricopeptide repeat protein [Polyangium jinanense]|uniref:Tetratricopeptide repeat protein n=1 Tax=Polyangium jinanense TaxID=2829994 RepID=A0A9X3XHX6_9BACT|nr:tetratricopeptide repeat protein [Polyangium jinanense]MDC3960293.1 tetratricopeptide repeat protein [Polyangium jinanense]MDC3988496.1 tetratricopeptide repeat protein [Polyangium jinanense]
MTSQGRAPNATARACLDKAAREIAANRPREAYALADQAIEADGDCAATLGEAGRWMLEAALFFDETWVARMVGRAELVVLEALGLDWSLPVARETIGKISAVLCRVDRPHRPEVLELLNLGNECFMASRFAEAEPYFVRATKLDPTDATAHKYLGNTYYNQKRLPEAVFCFRRATELDPLDPQAFKFLADAHFMREEHKLGWHALYGAIAANPRYWSAWLMLDRLLAQSGVKMRRFFPRPAALPDFKTKTIMVYPSAHPATAEAWKHHAAAWLGGAASNASRYACALDAITRMTEFVTWLRQNDEASFRELDFELMLLPELAKRGDLRHVVLVLCYEESFRPELEAYKQQWAKATGDPIEAVQNFLVRTRLRPL